MENIIQHPWTASESEKLVHAARREAHCERAKAICLGALATLVSAVALPIIAALGFFGGSAAILASPDALFFPIIAAVTGGGGAAGWKIVEGTIRIFRKYALPHWERARELDAMARMAPHQKI